MNHAVLSRLLITLIVAFAVASPSFSDPAPGEFYNGQSIAQAPAKVAAWGGGNVTDNTDSAFAPGKQCVLASINGPYQGVVFTIAKPLPLGDPRSDKTRYLSLTFSQVAAQPPVPPAPPKKHEGLPDRIGSTGANPLLHFAQFPGANDGAVQPDQAQPGGVAAPTAPPPPPPLKSLRVALILADGSAVEYVRAIPDPPVGTTWVSMGIPLAAMAWSSDQAKDAQLASVMIGGDTSGSLYVAAVSVNSDTDPIAVTVSGDTEFSASQPGNYTALVNAGSSNVTWTWNANDGTPVEHGQTFTHQFARAGKYNVQCTIADIDGLKKPVTGSFTVVVQAD